MPTYPGEFAGAAVVITGGASGIGQATAEAFVTEGAHAIIIDRDASRLAMVTTKLREATPVHGDVSRWEDCQAAAQAAQECGRPVRALVNSAAYFGSKGENATAEDWDMSLGVNVKGTALMASAIMPLLRQSSMGAIVNISSISGYIAQPNRWTYNATKGAILSLTRCQALDFARDGIRVNSVSPGTIWTPELDRMATHDRSTWEPIFGREHMLNRVGEPSEVANTILFLCSQAASFITGADLLVDGGYVAMGHNQTEVATPYTSE
jgi:NAD(P)-dependent dehydrogenase (short-subunit alcohol dehydrogenase family)